MNILFLSLLKFDNFDEHNIYTDLLRELIKNGHNVFAVSPAERRDKKKTNLKTIGNSAILTVKTLNIQKTNVLEKGMATLLIKKQFIRAIKKFFKDVKFDLILYPTPPITLCGVVKYFKKRDNARTYLMLKDIFPQNAVDLGLIKTTGVTGLIYKYFRKQEKKLYSVSDTIGCMSPANIEYVLEHNPEVSKNKVELFPNCIEIQDMSITSEEKQKIRKRYNLPQDKIIFVYGGNLGKPQGIPFIIKCLESEKDNNKVFFLIIGDGTEFATLEAYKRNSNQSNFELIKRMPSSEFDKVVASCDVGMVFLDYRFTIPNFPSRILSYMQASLPVLACTDSVTDLGAMINEGQFGWFTKSDNPESFHNMVLSVLEFDDLNEFGKNALKYLIKHYSIKTLCNRIFGSNLK